MSSCLIKQIEYAQFLFILGKNNMFHLSRSLPSLKIIVNHKIHFFIVTSLKTSRYLKKLA